MDDAVDFGVRGTWCVDLGLIGPVFGLECDVVLGHGLDLRLTGSALCIPYDSIIAHLPGLV